MTKSDLNSDIGTQIESDHPSQWEQGTPLDAREALSILLLTDFN